MQSTNSNINLTQSSAIFDVQYEIDAIEYPSIDGIEMKIQVIEQFTNDRPQIDRSSKESAMKALEKKELLAEKALISTKNNLEVENQLSQVYKWTIFINLCFFLSIII